MGTRAPRTLLQLAAQGLLTKEAVAISALEDLPVELFPPLFTEALASRSAEALRAMVRAWPFPCLPLGALMKTPHLDTLQAVLDGLDGLLSLQVRPRRWRLQVLDLRNVHQNFWNVWSGVTAGACSPRAMSDNQTVEDPPGRGVKQPFKVVIDLCLRDLNPYQTDLLEWVQQRKSVLQASYKKMPIWALPVCNIRDVLRVFEPEEIQELELSVWWDLSILAWFGPSVGQMRNLHKLFLRGPQKTYYGISPEQQEVLVTFITCQFPKLNCLRQLYMDNICFLEGNVDRVLRRLGSNLESLSVTHCQLSEADWRCLSHCPTMRQLKYLDLSDIALTHVCPMPFQVLLERVSATLKSLDLQDCGIGDTQLSAILPALSRCSQLTMLSLFGNHISTSALKDLLRHTAGLSHLRLELYPVPLDSYDNQGAPHPGTLAPLCAELLDTLRAGRQPGTVLFGSDPCPQCGHRYIYDVEARVCRCRVPA